MADFKIGETVICSIEIRDTDESLSDPATSTTCTIKDPKGATVVNAGAMTNSSTGKYYRDYTIASGAGEYRVYYTATDGTRITKRLKDGRLYDSFTAD